MMIASCEGSVERFDKSRNDCSDECCDECSDEWEKVNVMNGKKNGKMDVVM